MPIPNPSIHGPPNPPPSTPNPELLAWCAGQEARFTQFSFRRASFHFTALDPLLLPAGQAANAIRGALGLALHRTAPPETYARLFHPQSAAGPSGLADPPRPFVLRCSGLEGLDAPAGATFAFDLHLFDLADATLAHFADALKLWAEIGLGPARAKVFLDAIQAPPVETLSLAPASHAIERLTVRFATPTELKSGGLVAPRPEFPILFARVRDRIASLAALYGGAPLDCDFAGLGERAAAVVTTRCDIRHHELRRHSAATGQRHPIGGFTGEAEYTGALAEFAPWLVAAQFAGVGRQTVWGKGELQVLI